MPKGIWQRCRMEPILHLYCSFRTAFSPQSVRRSTTSSPDGDLLAVASSAAERRELQRFGQLGSYLIGSATAQPNSNSGPRFGGLLFLGLCFRAIIASFGVGRVDGRA